MTLRAGPLEHDAKLPDGRSVRVRVGLPEDGYIRAKDLTTVTLELYGDGEHLAAINTILDPDQVDEATHLLRRTVTGLELFDDEAPKTVENFVSLARKGFYDGVIFHRVIPDFMIQGGDPTGTGSGGPGYMFEDEFNDNKVERGALAMANAGPNTNGSQFFIVTADACPWLDGKHTVFGRVTSGMDVVDAISEVDRHSRAKPREDVSIQRVELSGPDQSSRE